MKLMSWNVNGLRAVLKKNFLEFLEEHDPDVLCLQETKAHPEQVELELPQYQQFWNSAVKKGYSGTLILTKKKPKEVSLGINIDHHDQEGRVITAFYPDFTLVNVYTPNSQDGLRRLDYRQEWDQDFANYIQELNTQNPVIVCGDLNVAHQEIDLARPAGNHRNPGFTDEERAGISRLLENGMHDSFRYFNPETPEKYTWWSYRTAARKRNVGWRIDYFCVSHDFENAMAEANIHDDVLGSDHCPVSLELK